MKKLFLALAVLAVIAAPARADQILAPIVYNGASKLGWGYNLKFTGAGVSCVRVGTTVTCTIAGSSGTFVDLSSQAQQFGTSGNTSDFIQFHSSGTFVGSGGTYLSADGSIVALNAGSSPRLSVTSSSITANLAISWTGATFASLGTPSNGTIQWCSDCTVANPCAGSGTGAFAERENGAWVCNGGSTASGTVTSVAAGTGLSGGTITTTGTISMPNTGPGAVTTGTSNQTISTVTTDAQGRISSLTTAPNTYFSLVDLANAQAESTLSGNFTTGRQISFAETVTITGVRIYWGGAAAKTIKCQLWDPSNASQKTVSISVNGAGVYTGTFATSYTVPAANVGKPYVVSQYETGGTLYMEGRPSGISGTEPACPYVGGRAQMICPLGSSPNVFVAGDAFPSSAGSTTAWHYIEPIYQ